VIETVMIAAAGFLAAALLALLIIPAVNARAERLAGAASKRCIHSPSANSPPRRITFAPSSP
jgi:hypothetical protein